eukprot:Gb_31178 [translate_table: standard]
MRSEGGYTTYDLEQCLPSEFTGDRIPAADVDPLLPSHVVLCTFRLGSTERSHATHSTKHAHALLSERGSTQRNRDKMSSIAGWRPGYPSFMKPALIAHEDFAGGGVERQITPNGRPDEERGASRGEMDFISSKCIMLEGADACCRSPKNPPLCEHVENTTHMEGISMEIWDIHPPRIEGPTKKATYGTVQGDEATNHSGTSNDYYQFIQPAKPDGTAQTFTVSDMETILVYNTHVLYAIGYKYAGRMGLDRLAETLCPELNEKVIPYPNVERGRATQFHMMEKYEKMYHYDMNPLYPTAACACGIVAWGSHQLEDLFGLDKDLSISKLGGIHQLTTRSLVSSVRGSPPSSPPLLWVGEFLSLVQPRPGLGVEEGCREGWDFLSSSEEFLSSVEGKSGSTELYNAFQQHLSRLTTADPSVAQESWGNGWKCPHQGSVSSVGGESRGEGDDPLSIHSIGNQVLSFWLEHSCCSQGWLSPCGTELRTDDGDLNIDDDPVDSWHCPPPIQINAIAICGGASLIHVKDTIASPVDATACFWVQPLQIHFVPGVSGARPRDDVLLGGGILNTSYEACPFFVHRISSLEREVSLLHPSLLPSLQVLTRRDPMAIKVKRIEYSASKTRIEDGRRDDGNDWEANPFRPYSKRIGELLQFPLNSSDSPVESRFRGDASPPGKIHRRRAHNQTQAAGAPDESSAYLGYISVRPGREDVCIAIRGGISPGLPFPSLFDRDLLGQGQLAGRWIDKISRCFRFRACPFATRSIMIGWGIESEHVQISPPIATGKRPTTLYDIIKPIKIYKYGSGPCRPLLNEWDEQLGKTGGGEGPEYLGFRCHVDSSKIPSNGLGSPNFHRSLFQPPNENLGPCAGVSSLRLSLYGVPHGSSSIAEGNAIDYDGALLVSPLTTHSLLYPAQVQLQVGSSFRVRCPNRLLFSTGSLAPYSY